MTPVSIAAWSCLIQSIKRGPGPSSAEVPRHLSPRSADFSRRNCAAVAAAAFLLSSNPSSAWRSRPVLTSVYSLSRPYLGGPFFISPLRRHISSAGHVYNSPPSPSDENGINTASPPRGCPIRLSKLIASHGLNMQMSRRSANRLIEDGMVTVAGRVVEEPGYAMTLEEASAGGGIVKVAGRLLRLPTCGPTAAPSNQLPAGVEGSVGKADRRKSSAAISPASPTTRVWLAHKLTGEVVAENDPHGRPSLLERLRSGGVGKAKKKKRRGEIGAVHLKPIGRLDMMTEGLIVVTNDGQYARDMELPSNGLHRTYRVRVHGRITPQKLKAIRSGIEVNGISYRGMRVNIEASSGGMRRRERATNTWLRITCTEGKNRQIRKVLEHLGLTVTRLIRTSFGDYDLFTIPPGLAIEVPFKPVKGQKRRGPLQEKWKRQRKQNPVEIAGEMVQPVEWIRHI